MKLLNKRVSQSKRGCCKEAGKIADGQNWERDNRGHGKGGEKKRKRQTGVKVSLHKLLFC